MANSPEYTAALQWIADNILCSAVNPARQSAVELTADLYGKEIAQVVHDATKLRRQKPRRSVAEARRTAR